jgi:hypothetical protein
MKTGPAIEAKRMRRLVTGLQSDQPGETTTMTE